jgi:hypothetical protein
MFLARCREGAPEHRRGARFLIGCDQAPLRGQQPKASGSAGGSLLSVAVIYAGLGDREQALTFLEKACDARGMSGLLVNADPRYYALRSEPRFQQLLRRMHLA